MKKQQQNVIIYIKSKNKAKIYSVFNRISGVMVSFLALNVVDHEFELRLGQTKDYKIDNNSFSAKHAALRKKLKDWLAQNEDNVSE